MPKRFRRVFVERHSHYQCRLEAVEAKLHIRWWMILPLLRSGNTLLVSSWITSELLTPGEPSVDASAMAGVNTWRNKRKHVIAVIIFIINVFFEIPILKAKYTIEVRVLVISFLHLGNTSDPFEILANQNPPTMEFYNWPIFPLIWNLLWSWWLLLGVSLFSYRFSTMKEWGPFRCFKNRKNAAHQWAPPAPIDGNMENGSGIGISPARSIIKKSNKRPCCRCCGLRLCMSILLVLLAALGIASFFLFPRVPQVRFWQLFSRLFQPTSSIWPILAILSRLQKMGTMAVFSRFTSTIWLMQRFTVQTISLGGSHCFHWQYGDSLTIHRECTR